MAFCVKCGEELLDGALYCGKCGKRTEVTKGFDFKVYNEKELSDFKIKRCPSCGQGIPSFVTRCPACDNELSSIKNSETLLDFVSKVNACEEEIAKQETKPSEHSSSASKNDRLIVWIIFNIIFLGIPYFVSMILPAMKIHIRPKFSYEENELILLIQNFTVPNDRESILETLIYVKEKIDYLSNENPNNKNLFWLRLWNSKSEQIKEKADLLFPNDEVVKKSLQEIAFDKKRVNKKLYVKAVIASLLIFIIVSVAGSYIRVLGENIKRQGILEVPKSELTMLLPELKGVRGQVIFHSRDRVSIECYGMEMSEKEDFLNKCIEKGFDVDPVKESYSYEAFNKEGDKINLYFFENEFKIYLYKRIEMVEVKWPSIGLAKAVPAPSFLKMGKVEHSSDNFFSIYLGEVSKEDFLSYIDFVMENGFDRESRVFEDMFYGLNKDGVELTLRYKGFQMMTIDAYNTKESENKK